MKRGRGAGKPKTKKKNHVEVVCVPDVYVGWHVFLVDDNPSRVSVVGILFLFRIG